MAASSRLGTDSSQTERIRTMPISRAPSRRRARVASLRAVHRIPCSRTPMKHAFALAAVLFPICTFAAPAKHADGWIELLDKSFSQWDVYLSYPGDVISSVVDGTAPRDLKPIGLNKDEQGV